MTVANAAPPTPIPSTPTNSKSSATLSMAEIIRKYSGWRLSPTAWKIPFTALYRTAKITPPKYTRKYSIEFGSTSAGVCIQSRIVGVSRTPTSVSTRPATIANATDVCTAIETFS